MEWDDILKFKDNLADTLGFSGYCDDRRLTQYYLGISLSRKQYNAYRFKWSSSSNENITQHIDKEKQNAKNVGHTLTHDEIMLRMLKFLDLNNVRLDQDDKYPELQRRLEKYMKQQIVANEWQYSKDITKDKKEIPPNNKRPPEQHMMRLKPLEEYIYQNVSYYYQQLEAGDQTIKPDESLVNQFIFQAHLPEKPRSETYLKTALLPEPKTVLLSLVQEKQHLLDAPKLVLLEESPKPELIEANIKKPHVIDLVKHSPK